MIGGKYEIDLTQRDPSIQNAPHAPERREIETLYLSTLYLTEPGTPPATNSSIQIKYVVIALELYVTLITFDEFPEGTCLLIHDKVNLVFILFLPLPQNTIYFSD